MFEKIVSLKAEAEKSLLLAQAKVEVYEEILAVIKDDEVCEAPEAVEPVAEEQPFATEESTQDFI